MKKLLFFSLICFFLFEACQNETDTMYLQGTIPSDHVSRVLMKRGQDTLVTAPVEHGEFRLTWQVDEPSVVTLYWKGNKAINNFIAEPGSVKVTFKQNGKYRIEGGTYNELVMNSWKEDPQYIKAENEYDEYWANAGWEQASQEEKNEISDKGDKYFSRKYKTRSKILQNLYDHDDPRVRLLALQVNNLGPDVEQSKEMLAKIEAELGTSKVVDRLQNQIANWEKEQAGNKKIAIGQPYLNFTANMLTGDNIELKNVVKSNTYTLLEFWASWCSPCRGEIPNMKMEYEQFHDKGFEIFSMSIDDKKSKWKKASDEEDLPWIDAGDMDAFESPAARKYTVQAIPKNFLIDSKGTIVARDLRGGDLGKKLEELLN